MRLEKKNSGGTRETSSSFSAYDFSFNFYKKKSFFLCSHSRFLGRDFSSSLSLVFVTLLVSRRTFIDWKRTAQTSSTVALVFLALLSRERATVCGACVRTSFVMLFSPFSLLSVVFRDFCFFFHEISHDFFGKISKNFARKSAKVSRKIRGEEGGWKVQQVALEVLLAFSHSRARRVHVGRERRK